MKSLTIGQLAKYVGVKVSTIRFYERRKLLVAPERSDSGYRQYSTDSVLRLRLIKRSKELGFTLEEISELVELLDDENTGCDKINERAAAKLTIIDHKIQSLQKIKKTLLQLQSRCPGQGSIIHCPIVEEIRSNQDLQSVKKENDNGTHQTQ